MDNIRKFINLVVKFINPVVGKNIDNFYLKIANNTKIDNFKFFLKKFPYVTLVFFIINMSLFDFEKNQHRFKGTLYEGKNHLDNTLMDEYTPLALWLQLRQNLLHGDKDHLKGNMMALILLGPLTEIYFGPIKTFLIICFAMGLCTTIKYFTFNFYKNFCKGTEVNAKLEYQTPRSLGFSGVIYALKGILFILALFVFKTDNYLISGFGRSIIAFLVGLTVVLEFKAQRPGIGHFTHVIGFLSGLILMLILDKGCI